MAYFNNAATTYPKPDEVYSFMDLFYKNNSVNSGRGGSQTTYVADNLIKETRELVTRVLNCPTKQVIFEPTATIALNIIVQGVIKSGARNIYISPFEHNAVTRILHYYEKQGQIVINQLFVSETLEYDLERIKYQFDSVKPDFVIVSHASNVIGLVAPVEEIFTLAKKYEATTLVDMAQTAGLVKCNIGLECFDFAVFAGHKTLYGPTGISGFVMKPELKLPPVLFGGTGYDSANQNMPDCLPERFEIGTVNILGIAGLNASLKWIEKQTIENIRIKENLNRNKLLSILKRYWFIKIVGLQEGRDYVGVVSFLIEGISSDSAEKIFEKCGISVRTGLQCAPYAHKFINTYPVGTIRLSISYFTSDADFDDLEKALDYIDTNL
ncbi:aminotransferase class V-fold PLP-dependent enzyme [[Clostridium] innocuum]|uniref:aminotransferase class V-fold PLP-dependent enzyme n=1 Tax=Clostridium innocuum TaxID=1522 RepID=UPI000C2FBB95|nr:aminotransferase class V-fold PLP-dependent enzyme [[Clostridium] innocuum]MCR0174003.1 aminotransferase class V-fold PLP-dependent enzyme [[Clostridium] innocuum]MCR0642932.1 aminotransferase class V-fold PLP-dependent enzyme [[Clostridium] innocuum]